MGDIPRNPLKFDVNIAKNAAKKAKKPKKDRKYFFEHSLAILKAARNRPRGENTVRQAMIAASIELRAAGLLFNEIADALGIHQATAAKYVRIGMTDLCKMSAETIEEIRQLECMRLDKMFFVHYHKAIDGDTWSTDRCLAIMERRAKYLGLDKPLEHILKGDAENPITFEEKTKAEDELLTLFQKLAGVVSADAPPDVIDITPRPKQGTNTLKPLTEDPESKRQNLNNLPSELRNIVDNTVATLSPKVDRFKTRPAEQVPDRTERRTKRVKTELKRLLKPPPIPELTKPLKT